MMKLTIAAIVRWEALRDKSFYLFDASEEDLHALLYCVEGSAYPYADWEPRNEETAYKDLTRAVSVWGQYIPTEVEESTTEGQESGKKDPARVGDLVADLIVSGGADAGWVYSDMTFVEMDELQKAMQRKQRYELEHARLWTFFTVIPHISGNKIKKPEDLYPFPWEGTNNKIQKSAFSEEDIEERLRQLEEDNRG